MLNQNQLRPLPCVQLNFASSWHSSMEWIGIMFAAAAFVIVIVTQCFDLDAEPVIPHD